MLLLRGLYLLLFFSLPLSLENFGLGFGVNIPGEPLQGLIALALLFYWKDLFEVIKSSYKNPLLVFIAEYIAWSWISCLFSAAPVVSAKYTLIETLHIVVFGAGILLIEKKHPGFFLHCMLAYGLSFIPIMLRGWYWQAYYNFAIDFSAAAMRPFYRDHPLYGATIAFIAPLWLYLLFSKEALPAVARNRKFTAVGFALFVTGLFLSFSRAAWLTTLVAAGITLILYYNRQNLRRLVITVAVFAAIVLIGVGALATVSQKEGMVKNTTVVNQLLSSFNWSYDVANLERINRYKCAWRMFKEKPFTGFGNNMYKFTYLKYQRKEEMTRISLNEALPDARSGTGGNSHSDYLAALTELGLPGFIFWCGIAFSSLWLACLLYIKNNQLVFAFIFCALFAYLLHVTINNFIHDDKVSAFFWLCCGVLIANNNNISVKT